MIFSYNAKKVPAKILIFYKTYTFLKTMFPMQLIPMTLQEKNSPQKVQIFWSEFLGYPLGICWTEKGISHVHFIESQKTFLQYIADFFKKAQIQTEGNIAFSDISSNTLHIFASDFQLRVFQELMKIPF